MANNLPSLFQVLNASGKHVHEATEIPLTRLKYYNDNRKLPVGEDLDKICSAYSISRIELSLALGVIDNNILEIISSNYKSIAELAHGQAQANPKKKKIFKPSYTTELGQLFQADCIDVMKDLPSDSIDMIFADPPFNLSKLYPSQMNDSLKTEEYIHWQESWISECTRLLKYGGSLFIWNLPKWNTIIAKYLDDRLNFKHWIAVDLRYSLPIQGRLYPAHYSLLYYIKGEKPNIFSPDRVPMEVCPKCSADLVDYGGYKDKMNPLGVNLSDIWYDIPPVRHSKYKRRVGANELSLKLMDRIIEMSTEENDTILDPFGGSGTTYVVAEIKQRKWIGAEIGPLEDIINRFSLISEEKEFIENIRRNLNCLFTKDTLSKRHSLGLWTPESIRMKKKEQQLYLYNK